MREERKTEKEHAVAVGTLYYFVSFDSSQYNKNNKDGSGKGDRQEHALATKHLTFLCFKNSPLKRKRDT